MTMRAWAGPRGRLPVVLLVVTLLVVGCGEDDAVVEEPEIITVDSPFSYPKELWNDGVEGEVVVMVRVTETGVVDSVYVLEPSGVSAFDSVAVVGALDLRFAPGRRDDRRTTMWARLPVRFQLNDTIPPMGARP